MRRGGNEPAEALRPSSAVELARLQPLNPEDTVEQVVLHRWVVTQRVVGGIPDDGDLPPGEIAGILQGKHQRLESCGEPLHLQQCHVPVRMDHPNGTHPQERAGAAATLASQVERGTPACAEEDALAKASGEDLGDMPIGHKEAAPDYDAGAGVGYSGLARQLDPADRRDGRAQPRMEVAVGDQMVPQVVPAALVVPHGSGKDNIVVNDVESRSLIGHDDRLDRRALVWIEFAAQRELLRRPARHSAKGAVHRRLGEASDRTCGFKTLVERLGERFVQPLDGA